MQGQLPRLDAVLEKGLAVKILGEILVFPLLDGPLRDVN